MRNIDFKQNVTITDFKQKVVQSVDAITLEFKAGTMGLVPLHSITFIVTLL